MYEYNNHPHSTLSKYAGRKVCPLEVQQDDTLEQSIVYLINLENMNIMNRPGFNLPINQKVNVYDVKDPMVKYRQTTRPGDWVINGRKGMFYEVKDKNTGKTLYLTRFRLDPKWQRTLNFPQKFFSGSNGKVFIVLK